MHACMCSEVTIKPLRCGRCGNKRSRQDPSPCQMAEMRVGGGSDELTADFTKLGSPFAERDDLSGTHEGEIKRIEEQHDIFP